MRAPMRSPCATRPHPELSIGATPVDWADPAIRRAGPASALGANKNACLTV